MKDIETVTREKKSNNSTDESEYEQQDAIKVSQKRNSARQDTSVYSQDTENLEQNRNKRNEEINDSRFKKRKIDESKNIDDIFTNISNAIMNYLESSKENTINNVQTVDQSFIDYIRLHLQNIAEPEKSAR